MVWTVLTLPNDNHGVGIGNGWMMTVVMVASGKDDKRMSVEYSYS